MRKTFADKAIKLFKNLTFEGHLPEGYKVINTYTENPETLEIIEKFYQKFYGDFNTRKFIIGINPGRHGAGVTGVPFTDTKRLESKCGISTEFPSTHGLSSVFIYDMIEAYGGVQSFYESFYFTSPFPLAIVRINKNRNWVNANYYDTVALYNATKDYMIQSLKVTIKLGIASSEAIILGKKNAKFIEKLNQEAQIFSNLIVLEHPRYIQQYRLREKELFIDKYMKALNQIS